MPPKNNPLKLNPLQLRTLTLLQALAVMPDAAVKTAEGEVIVTHFPHAHGDHFHLGGAVVASADATGLTSQAVWHALERKGLAQAEWPRQIKLTLAGLAYETGLADEIFHIAHH